jgi:hypothetical protein
VLCFCRVISFALALSDGYRFITLLHITFYLSVAGHLGLRILGSYQAALVGKDAFFSPYSQVVGSPQKENQRQVK